MCKYLKRKKRRKKLKKIGVNILYKYVFRGDFFEYIKKVVIINMCHSIAFYAFWDVLNFFRYILLVCREK